MAAEKTRLMTWLWALALLALIAVAVLLVTGKQWREPPEIFRFNTPEPKDTGSSSVLFREMENLDPGLEKITGLAAASDGHLYAAGEKTCTVLAAGGLVEKRIPLPETPHCVACVPGKGLVFGMENYLLALRPDDSILFRTEAPGEKAYFTSIAADDTDIFVADAGERVVLRYTWSGELAGRIGEKTPGSDTGGFVVPSPYFDVALDNEGKLWSVNPGRHGLEQYRPDGSLVSSWYRPTLMLEGFCGCCNPAHIAFRPDGTLITAEKGLDRLKMYLQDWTFAGMVALPEAFAVSTQGDLADDLETPFADIAVDRAGRVLVADRRKNRIRVFEYVEEGR